MKHFLNIICMAVLLSSMVFTSCKNKKYDPMPVMYTKDKVTQPWSIDHMTATFYNLSTGEIIEADTIDGRSNGYYLHLNAYNVFVQNMDGTIKNGSWSMPNDYTIIFDGTDSYTIGSLTTNTMTLTQDQYGTKHYQGKIYLYR